MGIISLQVFGSFLKNSAWVCLYDVTKHYLSPPKHTHLTNTKLKPSLGADVVQYMEFSVRTFPQNAAAIV